ncbi:MAG: UDP-N-acetylmuramoyl-L-alanyl-D-glutamate--2,6-diaminopimelate ligase [Clostridia bacterium]|nr:UDP-N-acetylmuramoyl-L-alanyl-D-glutamate--2,6-diaminopimelate ligase [Clostridia bacterium]
MRSSELFRDTGIILPEDVEIKGIACDSRRVREGYVFLCHSGGRYDGHRYAREAAENGAVLVVGDHPTDGADVIVTSDTRSLESYLWYNFTSRPTDRMTKIAITGTAGKTSVAFVLRHILLSCGHRVGLFSTVGVYAGERELSVGENGGSSVSDIAGAMTTPDPEYFFTSAQKMLETGCDALVYEASSQAIAMGRLAAVVPDIVIYTNLSPEHLDYHGTMENYFKAKASLMEKAKAAIISSDDEWISRIYDMFPEKRIIRVSADQCRSHECDVRALKYRSHCAGGIEYVYSSDSAVVGLRSPLTGKYSVYNTLEAAACAIELGCDPMSVKAALSDFRGAPGRLERVALPGLKRECESGEVPDVIIDYAHTPEALKAVLTAVREVTRERLIVLFGCGGDRDRTKRPMMARAVLSSADHTVITSDNSRSEDPNEIIDDILTGVDTDSSFTVIPDRREAIKYAVNISMAGDVILLAGKGHEKYEIDATGKHPFDEAKLAREAMYEKYGRK